MAAAESADQARSQAPRPPRPNYGRIHAKPLPLDTFPLPPLIPHNPFSLIYCAYTYLSHLIVPPSSHGSRVRGWYHNESHSVHVTDATGIRSLWERGFFGKGSLSRSEPTWLDREKKRLGLLGVDMSEEFTQKRREERRRMKMERARREREIIEETLSREQRTGVDGDESEALLREEQKGDDDGSAKEREMSNEEPNVAATLFEDVTRQTAVENAEPAVQERDNHEDVTIMQQEHLQLAPPEAFFLSYGLGILDVYDPSTHLLISNAELLTLFRLTSHFPPRTTDSLMPYDPFLLSYVTYHHFRSLGWVVRSGLKFAVDWLLYLRGPAFAHAEFAVVVLPAFRDRYWWEKGRREETRKRERRDWWWYHCLQRVQAQVRKGLVIAWVEVPRPDQIAGLLLSKAEREVREMKGLNEQETGIGQILKEYKVRDMMMKRWIPNRNRD